MNFTQHRAAQAQHARKIYTSSGLTYNVSVFLESTIDKGWFID